MTRRLSSPPSCWSEVTSAKTGFFCQRLHEPGRRRIELVGRVTLEGVLVLREALAPAHAEVLAREQEQPGARHLRQLGAQPGHHLGDRGALAPRLEADEDIGRVGGAPAGEADDAVHRRVGLHDGGRLFQLLLHRLERDALVGLDAAHHLTRILLGEEALGDDDVEIDVEPDRREQREQHQAAMSEGDPQGPLISAQRSLEGAFQPPDQEVGAARRLSLRHAFALEQGARTSSAWW